MLRGNAMRISSTRNLFTICAMPEDTDLVVHFYVLLLDDDIHFI